MKKIALFVLLLCGLPALAQTMGRAPKVHASLIPETSAVAPGGTVTIALQEEIAPGWHTYWRNPGDAGQPSEIQWDLPRGWKAGAIQWPTPRRLPVASLMDYGYVGKPWLLIDLTAPATAKPGQTLTLKGHASWLVCENICIPEDQQVALSLRIGTPGSRDPRFAAARALLPTPSPWAVQYALGKTLDLFVAAPALAKAHPREVDFFPLRSGTIKDAAPQQLGFAKDGLVLRMQPGKHIGARGGAMDGVLVLTSADHSIQAINVSALPGRVPAASFPARGGIGLALALLFAFVGGLILNVMPCVLPVLAMKALALTRHGGDHSRATREGFAYSVGAVLSFVAFGVTLIVLRAGGDAIGWGFQLQNPIAVAFFALLIFAVGLNLSGVFELGSVTAGDSLARRGGVAGAFFTGILAVAVAAPCTVPFMAVALGFALTQTAVVALGIFLALGIGFALPFLLLAIWPAALKIIPKPGSWMLRFKQFLAFPMYAAAAWLVWVLALEAGSNAVAFILAAMILLALAAWLWNTTRGYGARGRGIGALAALLALFTALALVVGLRASQPVSSLVQKSDSYSATRLAALRAAGKPVFVDATAAWCITCLVNEQAVLSKPEIRDAFRVHHVVMLIADWTNRNAAITALLQAQGRSGVPLYLYYAPGAASPRILPQILTQDTVLAAISG
jgi:thiol:disulfide interchange protein DsbD